MRAIAKFAMRSPAAASINAAAYAVFALFFAPFIVISGATVALATLRSGASQGFRVLLGAGLIAGLAYLALLRQPMAAILVGTTWLPTLFAAQLLRATQSQGAALSVVTGFTALYAGAVRLLIPDVAAHWLARLEEFAATVRAAGGDFFSGEELTAIANVMHEATVVVVCLYWITTLLLARWWQSSLYNPGGFGEEFRRLTVPRLVSPIAAIIAVLALVPLVSDEGRGIASDLLVVLMVLFGFQGLAIIHHRAKKVSLSKAWLAGFYFMLVMVPQWVGFLVGVIGIADIAADFRGIRRAVAPE